MWRRAGRGMTLRRRGGEAARRRETILKWRGLARQGAEGAEGAARRGHYEPGFDFLEPEGPASGGRSFLLRFLGEAVGEAAAA